MSMFRTVVYGTGAIMVARPAADVVVAAIETTGKIVESGKKEYQDGYKQGWLDAKKYLSK